VLVLSAVLTDVEQYLIDAVNTADLFVTLILLYEAER